MVTLFTALLVYYTTMRGGARGAGRTRLSGLTRGGVLNSLGETAGRLRYRGGVRVQLYAAVKTRGAPDHFQHFDQIVAAWREHLGDHGGE